MQNRCHKIQRKQQPRTTNFYGPYAVHYTQAYKFLQKVNNMFSINLDPAEWTETPVCERQSPEESLQGLGSADRRPTTTAISRLVSANNALDSASRQPLNSYTQIITVISKAMGSHTGICSIFRTIIHVVCILCLAICTCLHGTEHKINRWPSWVTNSVTKPVWRAMFEAVCGWQWWTNASRTNRWIHLQQASSLLRLPVRDTRQNHAVTQHSAPAARHALYIGIICIITSVRVDGMLRAFIIVINSSSWNF